MSRETDQYWLKIESIVLDITIMAEEIQSRPARMVLQDVLNKALLVGSMYRQANVLLECVEEKNKYATKKKIEEALNEWKEAVKILRPTTGGLTYDQTVKRR